MIPRTLFDETHDSFRQSTRQFVEREVAPYHAEWEKAGVVPRELWKKAGELGLLCPDAPEEFGGAGGKGAIPEKSRGGHSVGSGKSKHVKSCA